MRFLKKIPVFLDNMPRIVVIFTAVMLVPSVVLALTEPYSRSTVTASLLLPAGFYLLWITASRYTGAMIVASLPFMILGAFQLVISYLFGNSIIAVDMFTNVFTTSSAEAGELLGSIYPSIIIVTALYAPLLLIGIRALRLRQTQGGPERRKGALAGALLMVLGAGFAGVSNWRNADFSPRYHIYPLNVCYNITLAIERWSLSGKYGDLSEGFAFGATRDPVPDAGREIYVFVIGEASRACSWSLFGYERETNPLLGARKNLVPFRNVLTESNTTHKSVPMMLSLAAAHCYDSLYIVKGIPALFGSCGFRTAFISNQPPNNSLIDDYAAQADTVISICRIPDRRGKSGETPPDGVILPCLKELLDSTDDNLFIVIHTYGSHADHVKRYPREFARFVPDLASSVSRREREKVLNAYDNTIVYTDYVLSEIISMLEETGACSALLYSSDHGEDVLDDSRNRFLHASPTTTYYQLHTAAFAWFSDAYAGARPGIVEAARANSASPAPASSMFNTMAGIASIRSACVDPRRSLVSPDFTPAPRMYINDYNQAVNVMRTGLTDRDTRLFDRHGIDYDAREYRQDLF